MMLLEESDGYKMGPSDKREIKHIHSLFIDDLKNISAKPPNTEDLVVNKILVQASMDTRAIYMVEKIC